MITKLIISLSLGLVVLGVKADSLDGQPLQKPSLDTENKPTYPQFLIPNSRLRVLIDPEQGMITAPQEMQDEHMGDGQLPRSIRTEAERNPNIERHPDGTISLALDKHHLKYHSIRRCAGPEHGNCIEKDEQTPQ